MIEELVRRAADEDDDAIEKLGEIANADPQSLSPYHHTLLDHHVLWPPTLYRAAGVDVVTRVIEQVDDGRTPDCLNNLLLILAHTAHPLAEDALGRWSTRPPAGADDLHVGALSYALEGGWTIGPDGNRRDLCADVAYRWVMRDIPQRTDAPHCPWCAAPLWVAADLDTTDPAVGAALAHTGWSGRLIIETCHFCAGYTTLYSQVTPAGGTTWWPGNDRPSYLGTWPSRRIHRHCSGSGAAPADPVPGQRLERGRLDTGWPAGMDPGRRAPGMPRLRDPDGLRGSDRRRGPRRGRRGRLLPAPAPAVRIRRGQLPTELTTGVDGLSRASAGTAGDASGRG
ncbi:hypothetical protein NKG94_21930 [Micromonospora sp. M12]